MRVLFHPGWLLACLLVLGSAGCEGWPRYLYEGIEADSTVLYRLVTFENESLDSEEIQHAGEVDARTEILLFGYAASCGYDDDADGPDWPEHPWDEDSDGVPDTTMAFNSGWFTGDVDWFGFTVNEDVVISGQLEWDNRPPGSSNAAYQPEIVDGDWIGESDLDFVIFETEGTTRTLVNESAVGHDYPEVLQAPQGFDAGARVAVAVGCHHQIPTDYALSLTAM